MTIIVEGSPRRGNGAFLADKIAAKYDAKTLRLSEIRFTGCTACKMCRENDGFCTLDDDLKPWFKDLSEAKKIILIAPNYFSFINGNTVAFLNRFYCMKGSDKRSRFAEGAKLAFILTQGSANRSSGDLALGWIKKVAENFALKFYGLVVPNCSDDNTDGVRLKEEEIMMSVSFFF